MLKISRYGGILLENDFDGVVVVGEFLAQTQLLKGGAVRKNIPNRVGRCNSSIILGNVIILEGK